MQKKEIAELKKRLTKDQVTFQRMAVCYVDCNKNKMAKEEKNFLSLEEDEFYKYLEIAKKCISGKQGNNLLDLEFPSEQEEQGGVQHSLMAIRASKLNSPELLDSFYDHIIDSYDTTESYLIAVFFDAYDVPVKTLDNNSPDESEEVYEYLLCAICPVELSKPGLEYREEEQRIGARIRDWVVGAPETAFLFPAFNDRSSDIHSVLFYTKNTKFPHSEFMSYGLGCKEKKTAAEKHDTFLSIVNRDLKLEENDESRYKLIDINLAILDAAEEYRNTYDGKEQILDENVLETVLKTADINDSDAKKIINSCREAFDDDLPKSEEILDSSILKNCELYLTKKELEQENVRLRKEAENKRFSANEIIGLYNEYEKSGSEKTFPDWLKETTEE